ncbi:GNAT family N-acetyltransferase [Sphingomonas lenta]|uniref:GNAT family N-acetyltransferase n=1 Tax=Sphingomonas lenta TaxID=1141887 RepID=A0A2A2SCS9_9SPHN|nr:GNAT family N-acetyltransferase [Sphingomonas lenta]PAX07058.1 GNAT family N-acetyltransferase [Sphingomonas lenta]
MTKPLRPDDFRRASHAVEAVVVDGLPPSLDQVADAGPASHAFLRRAWFAAAVEAYGGTPRTLVVRRGGEPALALPLVPYGPRALGLAMAPGSYWPFRSFPLSDASEPVLAAALARLARTVNVLRIGPTPDEDPSVSPLLAAARARGWAVLDRPVGASWLFRLGDATRAGEWPRGSTLKKNRWHEKQLAAHGALDWRFAENDDWPAAFDRLAAVEEKSWIATRTDGRDAKFTDTGHGRFWRVAARDERLRGMMRAALLAVDGEPAAFSFDLVAGRTTYAIANSYDPAYAKHSPGKLLYTRNLVALVERGVELVDWGMGDSGYKQVIGADEGPALRDWLLLRPGLPAAAVRLIARWWSRSGQTRR